MGQWNLDHVNDRNAICRPRVVIVGAMQCGTNQVGSILSKHPRVVLNVCDHSAETKHISQNFNFQGSRRGAVWEGHDLTHQSVNYEDFLLKFARRMPVSDGNETITFDKSPSYLPSSIFGNTPERLKSLLPNAKIIVSLCNPAERLYSEFYHTIKWTPEAFQQFYTDNKLSGPQDFTAFVDLLKEEDGQGSCKGRRRFCDNHRRMYLETGLYARDLEKWFEVYGRENVLVTRMDDDPESLARDILFHSNLPLAEFPWDAFLKKQTKSFQNDQYSGRASAYANHSASMEWLTN